MRPIQGRLITCKSKSVLLCREHRNSFSLHRLIPAVFRWTRNELDQNYIIYMTYYKWLSYYETKWYDRASLWHDNMNISVFRFLSSLLYRSFYATIYISCGGRCHFFARLARKFYPPPLEQGSKCAKIDAPIYNMHTHKTAFACTWTNKIRHLCILNNWFYEKTADYVTCPNHIILRLIKNNNPRCKSYNS